MSRTARTAGRVTRKAAKPAEAPAPIKVMGKPALTLRVDLGRLSSNSKVAGTAEAIGPGKVRLLELIDETGSISAAGRAMGMSYRQAWLLIDSMNQAFAEPVTETLRGGAKGGGAAITDFGRRLTLLYRAMETKAANAVADDLAVLERALSKPRNSGAD
jgi:molybdate transport system regulatory protein